MRTKKNRYEMGVAKTLSAVKVKQISTDVVLLKGFIVSIYCL